MATATRTWSFASDAEGLTDQGGAAAVTFAANTGDGNPAGCVGFTCATKNITQTETALKTTTGDTFASLFGLNAGDSITSIRLLSASDKVAANTKLSSHSVSIDLIDDAGTSICTILNARDPGTATTAWVAIGAQAGQSVSKVGSDGCRLKLSYTVTTSAGGGAASTDYRLDEIDVEVTYTAGNAITGGATIASAEAWGVASVRFVANGSGVASTEAFGQPILYWVVDAFGFPDVLFILEPIAIASAEAWGVPTVSGPSTGISVTGVGAIGSAETFGTAHVAFVIQPVGVASLAALGTPNVARILSPVGLSSTEALGVANLIRVLGQVGLASAGAFGIPGSSFIVRNAGAMASAEGLGTPTLGTTLIFTAGGIVSAEALGTPGVIFVVQPVGFGGDTWGTPTLSLLGGLTTLTGAGAIASAESFGIANLTRLLFNLGAIASGESLGTPAPMFVAGSAGAIVSSESFGQASTLARVLAAVGLTSAEAFGAPGVLRIVQVTGLASAESFGTLTRSDPSLIIPSAFGQAALSDATVYDVAIVDGETYLVSITDIPLADILLDSALGG